MDKTSSKMFQCKEILWELMEDMAKDYGVTRDYLINVAMTELAHSKGYLELPKNKNKNKVRKMEDSLLDDDYDIPKIPKSTPSFEDDDDFPEIPKSKSKSKSKPKSKRKSKPSFEDDDDFPDIPKIPKSKEPKFNDDMDFPDFPEDDEDEDFGPAVTDIVKQKPITPPTPTPTPTPTPPTPKKPKRPKKPKTPPKPPAPKLFVECDGDRVAVNKTKFVIGRGSQADLRIMNNPSISRRHALVIQKGGKYYLKDLGSINGTEYKGKKYDIKQISHGDVFTICDVPITFRFKKS